MKNYIVNQRVEYLRRVWVQAENADAAWEKVHCDGQGTQLGLPEYLRPVFETGIVRHVEETQLDISN